MSKSTFDLVILEHRDPRECVPDVAGASTCGSARNAYPGRTPGRDGPCRRWTRRSPRASIGFRIEGVDRAVGGADQGVQLVDEQDDVAARPVPLENRIRVRDLRSFGMSGGA